MHCSTLGVLTAAKAWFRDYGVTVSVDGPGTVTRSPDQATYAYGDIVTLTAQPVPPATFVGWSGDTTSAQSPLSISVTRGLQLTATFREPVSYVWKNSVSSGLWTDSLNWTPTRGTPTPNDILVFSGSGAVTARGLRSETIAQLLVSGTMQVAFESDSAATITLRGEGGPALSIAAGSRLSLTNTSPLTLALQRYAAGVIDGRLTLTGAAHRLVARDTAAVTFSAGSLCEIGTGESGGAFGDGTGTSGGRCVYFAAGSRLEQSAGGDPFGAPWYSAAIAFLPGSRYVVRGPGVTIALGGRTFADFEYDVPGGQTIVTLDAPVTMDSLVVRTGSLHITQSATLVLRGDLTLHPGGVLGLSAIYGGAPILLRGTATQRITTLGQIYWSASPPLEIDNPAGVVLGSQVRWLGPLRFWHGLLHTGPHAFDLGSTLGTLGAGASTGWVNGNLRRHVYSRSTPYAFAIGDSTRYAPLTLVFGSGPGDFEVTASTTAGLHPLLGSTPVDTSRSLRRWWSLSSPTATPANLSYEAILSLLPGELDSSVTTAQLAPMLYNAGWYYPTAGISSGTTVRANGLTLYGDLTAGLPLAGPVEPRYRWTAGLVAGVLHRPGSWTPPRLLRRVDDILEFSRGTVDTAYGVPIQSIGQLVVSNGTTATLSSTVNATLSFTGRDGDDLAIANGSTLRLIGTNGINSVQLVLADTATARISGTLELKDALHHLLGSSSGAIVFADGGTCVLSGQFDGNAFGTGGAIGSLGSVRFERGSTLRQSAGGDPFGTQLNDAVLTFEHGSRYRVESNAFTPMLLATQSTIPPGSSSGPTSPGAAP
ncbi:MAG: hypothetical protein IPJ04_06750 [Candidatus Eisenbacteria bacterium]|nr:hypothetical protein [Candidatus Eisenbacteria bacterium]